jgi:endonuclease/exonuclease/phosphatase (EEP) superfamily protein YafD
MNAKLNKKKLLILGLTQITAFFVFTFSLLTIFDDRHRYLELFSHFRAQYFSLSLFCTVLFLIYRNYKFAFTMALVVILNAVYLIPWYVSVNDKTEDKYAVQLKILHSNVYTANSHYQKLIALIEQENPDIVVVQETSSIWINQLAALKSIYPYKKAIPRNDDFGITIFSKYPFDEIQEIYWGTSHLPSLKANFTISGQNFTLISSHPLPPISDEFYISRNLQLNDIAKAAKDISNPLILIGDFNVTMWSADYEVLENGTGLRNARKGFGILATWPTDLPFMMIPIDHCLLSSEFKVDSIYTGQAIGSDHLPLVVTLSLKAD